MNNQPAFPTTEQRFPDGSLNVEATYGMTMLDYFAAKALQGFCANQNCNPTTQEHFNNLADDAYRMAEAMMAERAKRGL